MSFLKRYKVLVGLTAVFALALGGSYLVGGPCCGGGSCVLSSIFGTSTAYAGPGCSASKAEGASCMGKTEASATSASSSSCSAACKEKCVAKLMKDKGLTREQAEAAFAADMSSKTTVTTAAATSGCTGHAMATEAVATSGDAKTCSMNKEACIAKCMAEKGMTRAQAEACYAKCSASMAEGKTCHSGGVNMVQTAVASDGTPLHSREACIDACIAKGMTKAQAEACADKCGAAGFHTAAAIQQTDSKAAGCAAMKTSAGCSAMKTSAAKGGCCSKAKGSASEASTTTPAATDTKTTTTEAPAGGTN